MRRFFLAALTMFFVVAAAADAWCWGSVTGPRGGTAYRGAFGGGAYHGPNSPLLKSLCDQPGSAVTAMTRTAKPSGDAAIRMIDTASSV